MATGSQRDQSVRIPELVIVSGPNGAGKSTFIGQYLLNRRAHYLSADDLAKQLSPRRPEKAKIAAGRAFSQKVKESIETGACLVIESTLSGKTSRHLIAKAKRHNYLVTSMHIFQETPEICIDRVRVRVRRGGHDVPATDIRRRFYRSNANFWNLYRHEVHLWHLVYNSSERFRLIASGSGTDFDTVEDSLLQTFIKGAAGK